MGNKTRLLNVTGPAIARARVNARLTQEQLAAQLQVAGLKLDRVGLAKIETQIRSVFDHELIIVAAVLKLPVAALCPSARQVRKARPPETE